MAWCLDDRIRNIFALLISYFDIFLNRPVGSSVLGDARKYRLLHGCVVSACLISGPAFPQVLDEIVVVATMREESVQDVPISITSVSGEMLQQNVIRDWEELAIQIPNVSFSTGIVSDNTHIRGIGSGSERSFEQAVGKFVDNIYMPRSRHYRAPFIDIDSVEVARGPQSVLFGLNATAGAISIHTARSRPGDNFVTDITAEHETRYGGNAITAVVGGSPTEKLGLRLAGRFHDSGDGYWTNSVTGVDENDLQDSLIRASIVYMPTEKLSLDAKVEYSEFSRSGHLDELFTDAGRISDGDDTLNWIRGQDGSLLLLHPEPQEPGFDGELLSLAATVDYELGNHGTLTGIFGYADYDWQMYWDLDSTPVAIIDSGNIETYKQKSAEIRYTSSDNRDLKFLIGGSYLKGDLSNAQPNLVDGVGIGLGAIGFPVDGFDAGHLWSRSEFEQDESLSSIYGTLTWDVTDRLQLRGGARYVQSEKEHQRGGECLVRRSDGSFEDLDPAGNPNDQLLTLIGFCPTVVDPSRQVRSSDNVLPEISVQWSANGSTMLYAKVGKSAKSGGFVASTVVNDGFFEYDDETGTGYELGLKSVLGEGRGELNIAVFRTDYDDLQLSSFDPDTAAAVVSNVGEVRSQGVEIDGRWALSDTFTLGGAIGFLDAKFTKFDRSPCYPGEPMNPDGFSCDKTGQVLPFSPDYSGNLYLDVNAPMGTELAFFGRIDVSFSDSYLTNATLDPLGEQDAYARFNARVGIGEVDGQWSLSVIGKNLSGETINNFTEGFLGVYRGFIQAPRTVWLQGRYRFGKQ